MLLKYYSMTESRGFTRVQKAAITQKVRSACKQVSLLRKVAIMFYDHIFVLKNKFFNSFD